MRIILTIPLCCPPTVRSTGIMCAGLTPCAPRFNLITCKERKLLFLRLRSGIGNDPMDSDVLSFGGSYEWRFVNEFLAVRPVLHRKFAKSGNFYFYGCGPALTVTPLLQVCCLSAVHTSGGLFTSPAPCAPRFIFYSLQKVFKARHICRTL